VSSTPLSPFLALTRARKKNLKLALPPPSALLCLVQEHRLQRGVPLLPAIAPVERIGRRHKPAHAATSPEFKKSVAKHSVEGRWTCAGFMNPASCSVDNRRGRLRGSFRSKERVEPWALPGAHASQLPKLGQGTPSGVAEPTELRAAAAISTSPPESLLRPRLACRNGFPNPSLEATNGPLLPASLLLSPSAKGSVRLLAGA
jgi:hypothetical protein